MKKTIEIPVETAAALVMACTAIIEYILTTETLTEEDIKDELTHIQPYLNGFMEMT